MGPGDSVPTRLFFERNDNHSERYRESSDVVTTCVPTTGMDLCEPVTCTLS